VVSVSEPTVRGLVSLGALTDAQVAAARAVYEGGFPAAVRAPFDALTDVQPRERTQVLLGDLGDVLGLVLVRDLGDTRWTFLRYFVVTGDRRGQGIGGTLWTALCVDLAARGASRLLFDVEDPDDAAASADEATERHRRVRFYRRLGAELVDVETYAPPHHGAPGTDAMPLRLMATELDDVGGSTPPTLSAAGIDTAVRAVMWHRYGVDAARPE
jgi:GNAT superfamily N-acetyltransferase